MKEHLKKAYKGKYAVGAFVAFDYDDIRAIVEAAEEMHQSSVIIMTSEDIVRNQEARQLVGYVKLLQESTAVDLILHLDHGKDEELIHQCVEAGYPSIMYDGSDHPYEENLAITRRIVEYCHARDILVEGELGQLLGKEENVASADSKFTDPDSVPGFVEATGVDALAVSIGNVHGVYHGEPTIRFDILSRIGEKTSVPLVLHGGTGIPLDFIRRAISMGVTKVNVGTALKYAHLDAEREYINSSSDNSKVSITKKSRFIRAAVKKAAQEYIVSFGTK